MPASGRPSPSESNETLLARLLLRLRQGDERALEELFQRMGPALARFGTRFPVSSGVVEDVLAGVFIAVWERRAELDPGANLATYLYRAVRNGILDAMRKEAREQARYERELASGDVPGMGSASPADALAETNDRTTLLWEAARQLPEQQYSALWLRYTEGMVLQDVADSLGVSVAAVKSLLQRAHRTLRDRLGGVFEYL